MYDYEYFNTLVGLIHFLNDNYITKDNIVKIIRGTTQYILIYYDGRNDY